jgi:hypothetical protein
MARDRKRLRTTDLESYVSTFRIKVYTLQSLKSSRILFDRSGESRIRTAQIRMTPSGVQPVASRYVHYATHAYHVTVVDRYISQKLASLYLFNNSMGRY